MKWSRMLSDLVSGVGLRKTADATPTIAANDLSGRLAEEGKIISGDRTLVLVDVRRPDEFHAGHLSRAVNVPLAEVGAAATDGRLDRDDEFVMYCNRGFQSDTAGRVLLRAGYPRVWNLTGGMSAWSSIGGAVEKGGGDGNKR